MENKQTKDAQQRLPNPENYTIFHALVEAMEKKEEERDSRLRRFLCRLGLKI